MTSGVAQWLELRSGLITWARKKRNQAVPGHMTFFHCFGGISFFIILLQVATGIFMLFHYQPHPELALKSIEEMSNNSPWGALMRNMHRVGSWLLLLTVFTHLVRVVYQKAYANPRELNWITGVFQFLLVFLLLATGLLLPWDWRAYWSFAIWVDYLESWPLVGGALKDFLLDHFTINRGFILHIFLLPLLLFLFLHFHFKMIRRNGITGPL